MSNDLTFRDYLNVSTRPAFSFADMAREFNRQPTGDDDEVNSPPPTLHPSFGTAIVSLQAHNKARGWHKVPMIGKKFSFARSHIAYAMGPKPKLQRTPRGMMPVDGALRVCVLHATKGWRVHHGVPA